MENNLSSVETILHNAASLGRCVSFFYNGKFRLVTPLSLREKPKGTLFYGFCEQNMSIRSFRVSLMEHVGVDSYPARKTQWQVELGEHADISIAPPGEILEENHKTPLVVLNEAEAIQNEVVKHSHCFSHAEFAAMTATEKYLVEVGLLHKALSNDL